MIVIDTSALVAIFRQEAGFERFAEAIVEGHPRHLPSHAYLEFVMVTSREASSRPWLDKFVADLRIAVADIDQVVVHLAADAFFQFGKGRRHPARLNFADCMSYAVAKRLKSPLLYKGDDFIHTDIASALPA